VDGGSNDGNAGLCKGCGDVLKINVLTSGHFSTHSGDFNATTNETWRNMA
jgi:hypothetical protein